MATDSVSELEILFRTIVSQILEPLWILFHEMRQQHEEVDGSQGDKESTRILQQGKSHHQSCKQKSDAV